MPLAGSIGFGLVWGWLLAGLDGARAPWRTGLALATAAVASGIAGILAWTFAGTPALVGLTVAAALSGLLRLGWHRSLGVHV
jgi:hypothetical protein